VRLAKNVRANLRESAARPAEVQALRGDVESAVKENKALRDRVEVLEQTRGPRHSAPGKADGKAEGKKAAARRGGKRTRR
jgi:hypothetical protein